MGTYKYLIQGNCGDGWFTIMSFTPSMTIKEYINEQKEIHPKWDVRVINNPKYYKNGKDTITSKD